MNKYQKVIAKIVKDEVKKYIGPSKDGFYKTRILTRKWVKDLDFDELVNYKNLREAL